MSIQETDQELVAEFRSILQEEVNGRFKDFRGEVERLIKERSARAPSVLTGLSGAPATRALPLLGGDQKFKDWLRIGRGRSSRFAANYSDFRIEQKDVGPILSVPGINTTLPGIQGPPETALRLVELLPVVNLSSGGGVEYARESAFTPGADLQVEGEVKASTAITFEPKTASVKTLATILKASLQALSDTPGMAAWLDQRLRYAVQLKAEDWLLNAAAPDGLMASAGAIDPAFAPPAGATALDIVGAAIGQLSAQGYTVDGVVMSGSDLNITSAFGEADSVCLLAGQLAPFRSPTSGPLASGTGAVGNHPWNGQLLGQTSPS